MLITRWLIKMLKMIKMIAVFVYLYTYSIWPYRLDEAIANIMGQSVLIH